MKKLILLIGSVVTFCSCENKQLQLNSITHSKNNSSFTPVSLQCSNGRQWISFDTGKNKCGSLCINKVSFFNNGRYQATLLEKSPEGYAGGVYFIVEGSADYTVNARGYNAVTLHPQSGWRKQANNKTDSVPLNDTELRQKFTATYLWEKMDFPQMPSQDFLIMVKPGSNNNPDKSSAVKLRLQ